MKLQPARLIRLAATVCLVLASVSPQAGCFEPTMYEGKGEATPEIHQLEQGLAEKLKKSKPDQKADALYDVGKAAFEHKDMDRAEHYMRQSLEIEKGLPRTEDRIRTSIALAIVLTVRGKNDDAFEVYRSGLKVAEDAKLNESAQMIIDSMGVLALRLKRLDEADSYFKIAYNLAKRDGNVPTQMNSLTNQATVQRLKKNNEKALELLRESTDLAKSSANPRELGNALINSARVEHDLGKLEESNATYKKAATIFREDGDNVSAANALWSLAENCYDYHNVDDARDAYKDAIDSLKDEPASPLLCSSLIGLGATQADLGEFGEAAKTHQKALDVAKELGSRPREVEAILQLGNDLLLHGHAEDGLHKLLDGEKLVNAQVSGRTHGAFLIGIGRCYKVLGEVDLALKYYQAALKLFDDSKDLDRQAMTLNTMAVLALDAGRMKDFETWNEQARTIYRELSNDRELAILDYNLAQFYVTQLRFADAETLYQSAAAKISQTEDKVSQGRIMQGLGLCEFLLNQPDKALEHYKEAAKIADAGSSIEFRWDCKLGLGKCYKRLKKDDLAEKNLVDAVNLVEKERGLLTRDSFKMHNLDFRKDCFIELIDLYARANRPYDALEIAEKGRARAFLDMLASRHAKEKMRVPLAANPNDKPERVVAYSGPAGSEGKPLKETPAEKPQLLAMAVAGTRAVTTMPRATVIDSGTAVSPVNATAPDIKEIKTLVTNSKCTVLQYYLMYNQMLVWVIDPDTTIHMLPPIPLDDKTIKDKVVALHEAITSQPSNKDQVEAVSKKRQDLLAEMYMTLIAPVEQHLPKDESRVVTIVPHGVLFSVPFAALIAPDGKFLIEKHTLNYTPAIGVMRATQKLEETAKGQSDRLLAFGNPITKAIEFLGALPYSEKEVKNIATIFGAERSVVMTGEAANKRNFEKLAPQFTDVHLATHGLIDEENPMESSLVLAPSPGDTGLLSVKDILNMKDLKARLVVLSACQTGRGKVTGDGVVGLSRAFIIAGTPSVLVSQWNVDDIMTEYQMKAFYKSYLEGKGKAVSLRDAQIATIKFMEGAGLGNGRRANPRYWSAFQLIGESI